jgi:hypothetical protein
VYVKRYEVTRTVADDAAMHQALIGFAVADCLKDGGQPIEHEATVRFLDPSDPEQVNWIDPTTPPDMLIAMVEVPTQP